MPQKSTTRGRRRDGGVMEAEARIAQAPDVLREKATNGGEANAFVYLHLGVAIDDDLVQPSVGGENEAPVGTHLQAEAAVEEAEASGA